MNDINPYTEEQPAQQEDKPGFLGTIEDVGKGALGGVLDAGEAIVDLKDIFSDKPSERVLPKIETKTFLGAATNSITQMALGLVGAGKFLKIASWAGRGFKAAQGISKLSKGGKLLKGLAQGAIADFTVFDENEDRLSDVIEKVPALSNPITGFLASKEDDSKAERRLKNVLEGMALGGASELIFSSAKVARLFRKGNTEEAAKVLKETSENLSGSPEEINQGLKSSVNSTATDNILKEEPKNISEELHIDGSTASKLSKKIADEDLSSYTRFQSSSADKRLKETVSKLSSNLANDVGDLIEMGDKDVASAFGRALASNKKYSDFMKSVKDTRLFTLMTEAVRDKVISKSSFKDIKTQTRGLINAGFMDEAMGKELQLDHDTVTTLAPRLLLYRMESVAKAHRFANAVGMRLFGAVKDTENIEELAKDFSDHVAYTQSIISGLGQSLGSLRIKPNNDMMQKLLSTAEQQASSIKIKPKKINTPESLKIKEGVNSLEGTPLSKLTAKDYVLNDNKIKALNYLLSSGLDLENVEHLKALNGLILEDDNKFVRLFANANKTGYVGKTFRAIYANNLLSSPATHIFNTVGNTIKLLFSPATRIAGGIFTQDMDAIKHGLYQYAAYGSCFKDSLKMMKTAFKAGGGYMDDIREYPKIKTSRIAEDFQMQWAKKNIDKGLNPVDAFNSVPEHIKTLSTIVGYAGATGQLPLRIMGAEDEFFKQMAYRSEVYANAAAEASEKGIKNKAAYITEKLNDSFADGKVMDKDALQYAREMTWTQEIDNTGIINNAAYYLSKIKFLQPFVPFITTPTNLFKDIIAHSPFAYTLKDVREAIAKGGQAKAVAEGKIAMGQALCFGALELASNNMITGGYPKDPVAKQTWIDMGRLPYSFKIGNKYIPFNRLDPFGSFFGIVADLQDYSRRGGSNADEVVKNLLAAVIKNMTSKTYASGLSDAVDFLNNPIGSQSTYIIQNVLGGMVPFSGAMRFLARQIDPEMKEVQTMTDKLRGSLPILSFYQPSRYSWITGKPHEASYFSSDAKEDMVLEELLNNSANIRAGEPPKKLQGVNLSAEQYSRLCQLQGTIKVGGRSLYETLEDLFNTADYNYAEANVDEDGKSMKTKMIEKTIRGYRKAAIETLKVEDPSFVISIKKAQEQKIQQNKSNNNSTEKTYDLINL